MIQKPAKTLHIKFLVKSIEENRCLSRKLKYFFYILHIYLGLDFGFMKFKSFRAKVITKIIIVTYCMVVFTLEASSMFTHSNIFMIVWMSCYLLGYALYVLVTSFLTSDKSFCDLQNDLLAIDSAIKVDSRSYNLEFKLIFFLSSAAFIRFLYVIGFYHIVPNINFWYFSIRAVLYASHYLSNDVMMIMFSFVFYSVCCRVVKFIEFIKKDGTDIVSCEYTYKSMIDSTQEAMKTFEAIFIVCLFCNTPQIMMSVYCVIAFMNKNEYISLLISPVFILLGLATMVQGILMMFLPSYFGGQLSAENDNLKLALHKILLRETDDVRSRDLKRFIKYIEARPFKFTVFKIIPVDWTLPVLIINISVTYLIVAVQLSHLY